VEVPKKMFTPEDREDLENLQRQSKTDEGFRFFLLVFLWNISRKLGRVIDAYERRKET